VREQHAGRAVLRLDYQAYDALALKEGECILDEVRARFEIVDARCEHRVGTLELGDVAVWIGVSAAHRDAAFAACRYLIDEIKRRVPIWKREHYADGDSGWIHPE
jgi:molybdopterin synthase catalytic subunit